MKVIKNAKLYTGNEVIADAFIRFGKTIQTVAPMTQYEERPDDEIIDAQGKVVIPGFIDIHSHGGYGIDTMDADAEALDQMTKKMLAEGITSYFPTTMTQSDENIEKALAAAGELAENHPMIQGIHLEGPFVSPKFKGAQPEQYMGPGDAEKLERWYRISNEKIRLVTYAPELGDVTAFEDFAKEHAIILSAGHSAATYEELENSQAEHITHLYNGQRGLHHREPGVTGYGLLKADVNVEMIVDGIHICPEMVRLAYRAKGADGIVIITDSMRAKGMPNGEYDLGGQKVIVKDGEARLESGNLAGSVLRFDDAFLNMMKFTDCSVAEAVKMSSTNAAQEFNLEGKGQLEAGFDADMLIMDETYHIEQTILGGNIYDIK